MSSILWSMFWCLLGAFLLGGLFGWALKSLLGENKLTELENAWSARFRTKEQEFDTARAGYQTRISDLDSQLAASTSSLKAREASLLDWDVKYTKLQTELTAKAGDYDKAAADAAALRGKLAKAEADLTGKADLLAKAEAALQDKSKAYGTLETELGAMRKNFVGKETEIGDLTAKLATLAPLTGLLKERDGSIGKLEAEIASLKKRVGELDPLTGQVKDWEKKYLTVIQERDARDVEIGKLRSRVSELEPLSLKAKDWELKFLNLSGTKDSEVKELQKRVSELEPFQTKAKDWELKYLAVMKDKDSETATLRQRITELEPLNLRINEFQSTVTEKDTEIQKLRSRISELETTSAPVPAPARGDLIEIEGIGEVYYSKLAAIGMTMQAEMLRDGASAKGRREIAEKSGINESLILRWVNHIDLIRINGVDEQFAELLEAAGVDTVPELAQRNPDNLHPKLLATNEERHLVRRLPALEDVRDWVAEAKTLPRVVTH